jgi:protein SCO1
VLCGLVTLQVWAEPAPGLEQPKTSIRTFLVQGAVKELKPEASTVVVQHEEVRGYMAAMTMPFKAQNQQELAGLQPGDLISFRLCVSDTESWIDRISRTGRGSPAANHPARSPPGKAPMARPGHPLLEFKFTNELGQRVSLADFRGQALAITFFFTRCPLPEFCPRLSRNFAEASHKLLALTNAPANWHFLSFSFDPDFDTPSVLKAYAQRYDYDPRHWSFLTGPPDRLAEFAAQSDAKFERDGSFFNHNFRTLVIDAAGHLQMMFPIGGDLSDALVAEILKAAAVTNTAAR